METKAIILKGVDFLTASYCQLHSPFIQAFSTVTTHLVHTPALCCCLDAEVFTSPRGF